MSAETTVAQALDALRREANDADSGEGVSSSMIRNCCYAIAAVRAEERQKVTALVAALAIAEELLERNGIERPEIRAALVLAEGTPK